MNSVPVENFGDSLSDLDVENVYIYAGDAVRWDYGPATIIDRGMTIKTVCASTTSAPSFTSFLSGLYPTTHQVFTFNNELHEEIWTLFDLRDHHTGFLNSIFAHAERAHAGTDPIYRTLGIRDPPVQPQVDDTPFVFVERGPGGHAPYGEYSGGAKEYFEEHRDCTRDTLKADYERSIELDVQLFEDRIQELRSKGLLNDTLIVYTSDHGELLGENGMIGHNSPMCPETVYVPTVFIHPDLPSEVDCDEALSHVDLVPTLLDVLEIRKESEFDGQSLLDSWTTRPKCTIYDNEFLTNGVPLTNGRLRYGGVWDRSGGYMFPKNNTLERLVVLLGKLYKSPKRHFMRRNLPDLVKAYARGQQVYRDPGFSEREAEEHLTQLNQRSKEGLRRELDGADVQQLEDLGYL